MSGPIERRLGLLTIWRDNAATWTVRGGPEGRRDRLAAAAWYYLLPALPALALVKWRVEMRDLGQALSGVAIFTGLLFGLLVLIFETGVTLRADGDKITNAHGLRDLVGDLRANITYAAVVGMFLTVTLVVTSVTAGKDGAVSWAYSPVAAFLILHLGLMLMTVLRRLRTAFNYITR